MTSKENIGEDQIRAYVFGELTTEREVSEVEAALAGSEALRKLLTEYELTQAVLQNERARVLKEIQAPDVGQLSLPTSPAPQSTENDNDDPKPSLVFLIYRRLKPVLAAAAAVLLLVVPTAQTYRFADGAIARRLLQNPRSEATAGPADEINKAQEAFYAGRYEEAYALFSRLAEVPEHRATATYYLPLASFHLGEHERARREFAAIEGLDQYPPETKNEVAWFILLNDLALGEDISARLDSIDYNEDEKEALRDELNSFWRWNWLR